MVEQKVRKLFDLKNVGKATLGDLQLLEIDTVEELARCDATKLFHELERRTGKRHDPCVWDVFAAIIHEAKTGEGNSWWKSTPERKRLQEEGRLKHLF